MAVPTYTGVRADIADALRSLFPTFTVLDHLGDRIDNDTIMLLAGPAQVAGPCLWKRTIGIGVFMRWSDKQDTYDAMDGFTVTLRTEVEDWGRYEGTNAITDATIAGTAYLLQLHTIEVETTN